MYSSGYWLGVGGWFVKGKENIISPGVPKNQTKHGVTSIGQ